MRQLLTILFTFSAILLSAQPQAIVKNEKIKTLRIKFQQAPDGTLVKTEDDKVLELFFYDKQGRWYKVANTITQEMESCNCL